MPLQSFELIRRALAFEDGPPLWHQVKVHLIVWGANSSGEDLAVTLDSIASQEFSNFEALVVAQESARKSISKSLRKMKKDGYRLEESCDLLLVRITDNPIPKVLDWLMKPEKVIVGFIAAGAEMKERALISLLRALSSSQSFGVVFANEGMEGKLSVTAIPPPVFLARSEWLKIAGSPPIESECNALSICLMWARVISKAPVGVVSRNLVKWLPGEQVIPFFPALPGSSFPLSKIELERILSLACNLRTVSPLIHHRHLGRSGNRVVYIYPDCYHGGTEVALAHRIKAIKNCGFDVEKVVYRDGGGLEIFNGVCNVRVLSSTERGEIILKLAEQIARGDYQILHTVNALEPFIAAEVSGFKGPIFAESHWDAFKFEAGLQRLEVLITPSRYALSRVEPKTMRCRKYIIANGIDTSWSDNSRMCKFNPSDYGLPEEPNCPLILGVGRLSPEKRWDVFLEVAEKVSRWRKDLIFCLVGGGEAGVVVKRDFLDKLRNFNLGGRFVWIPQLNYCQMRGLYQYAASSKGVLLHPSPKEVFGMVFLEAMACGLPIVAIRSSGIVEVLRDKETAILVRDGAGVSERLANAVIRLLRSDNLWNRMAQNGKTDFGKRFNAKRSAKRIARLYEKAIEKHRENESKTPHAVFLSVRGFTPGSSSGRVPKLAQYLAMSGWDVTFIQAPGLKIEGSFGRLTVHSLKSLSPKRWQASELTSAERRSLDFELRQLLKRPPNIVINSFYGAVGLEVMKFCADRGAFAIYDAIDHWGLMKREWERFDKIRIGYREDVESKICEIADKVTAVSQSVAKRVISLGAKPEKVQVVPNGFDDDLLYRPRLQPPKDIPTDVPVAGFVGAMFGASTDFDLIEHLAKKLKEVTFVFIGWCSKRNQRRFAHLPNVLFLGVRPNEEIYRYIDWFDVGILPRRYGELANAMSPLKVFEYLSRGKPVVATASESIIGYPYVFQCQDFDQWESAMKDAFECEINWKELINFLQNHTWSNRVKMLLEGTPYS